MPSATIVGRECKCAVISKTSAVALTVAANDAYVEGLHITTALTGTCVVAGFADSDGTAQSITFPAGSVGFKDLCGAVNSGGALTVTCSNAADDNLVAVFWRGR